MTLQPGAQIGHYRVDGTLGAGGMGVVYSASDTRLNRTVVLKFLSETLLDSEARQRFQREAQMASALNHPHILTVHDVGSHEGASYIVTEFVDGGTLSDWLRREPRSWKQCAELMIGVADGLAAAHAANILHRDIKPANILVSHAGYAKLADFGLAKLALPTDTSAGTGAAVTRVGSVIGTLAYMSPEQVAGRPLDARSDIFSFGIVLYEMLSGQPLFGGLTDLDVMLAVTRATPPPLPDAIPQGLRSIVEKALEKDAAERYQSMRDLVVDLKRVSRRAPQAGSIAERTVEREAFVPPAARRHRAARLASGIIAALVIVTLGAGYFWNAAAQAHWAREEAVPSVARLTDEGAYAAAFELAARARRYVPDDSLLRSLAPIFSLTYSVTSTPPGASVYVRGYADDAEEWRLLGQTPLADVNVARRALRWRLVRDGFESVELATASDDAAVGPNSIAVTMHPSGTNPGMVYVPAGRVAQAPNGRRLPPKQVEPYFIDRYEVTNVAYKEFVDAGGYDERRYWEGLDLRRDGAPLAWEEVTRLFVDATGQPGPAAWELGDYPDGEGHRPVTGISWYEAAAYARYRGGALPSIYHWTLAALPTAGLSGLAAAMVPRSNYSTTGPADVGTYEGVGPFGTYDMHGNVSEWIANRAGTAAGSALGGSWQDAAYNFFAPLDLPLLERSPTVGFRLMREADPSVAALDDPVDLQRPPFVSRQPASDDVFAAYARQFVYRPGTLNASQPITVATTDDWIQQRVSVDTGYGERMDIVLFLPTRGQPPYQALVYFPPFDAVTLRASSASLAPGHRTTPLDFVVKSGRVVVQPIYQGTYERFREPLNVADEAIAQRRWVDWRWDVGRTLDYLETRSDIDPERVGYAGLSFGAVFPLHLPALEPRFRAALLISAGLFLEMPESLDPVHYARRITMPVLMVNGRYDYLIPVDAQEALFDLLGTPPTSKRHVLVESGHQMPRSDILRESIGWLEEALGPVL